MFLKEVRKAISKAEAVVDANRIKPAFSLFKITEPIPVIINAAPPFTLKRSSFFAVSLSISLFSYSRSVISAPVGYPPIRPKSIAPEAARGRRKTFSVIGANSF